MPTFHAKLTLSPLSERVVSTAHPAFERVVSTAHPVRFLKSDPLAPRQPGRDPGRRLGCGVREHVRAVPGRLDDEGGGVWWVSDSQ